MRRATALLAFVVLALVAGRTQGADSRDADAINAGTIGSLPVHLASHATGARLVVPNELRFNRPVPDNAIVTFAVPIANTGDRTLRLHEIRTGCLCTRVDRYPRTVAPGSRAKVEFRFDSSWDGPGEHGEAIDFVTNDPRFGTTRPLFAHDRWVTFTVIAAGHHAN